MRISKVILCKGNEITLDRYSSGKCEVTMKLKFDFDARLYNFQEALDHVMEDMINDPDSIVNGFDEKVECELLEGWK